MKQFELIKNPDNVSWNASIVGYVQEKDENEGFRHFPNGEFARDTIAR